MPDYRRVWVAGGSYFFTVNLLERKNDLLVRHINVLHGAVGRVKQARPFHIDAWVVLPDHMHCVWTLPDGDVDYSGRWKAIKIRFAKALPPTEYRSRARRARAERAIWQRRFSESRRIKGSDSLILTRKADERSVIRRMFSIHGS